jgi:hypothetical protein
MIYQAVSIEEVISKVIRDTRIQDSSYIDDMIEWIPEAMSLLQTPQPLSKKYKDIDIIFHKGKLPCGLIILDAVEYNGQRLALSSTIKNYLTGHRINDKQHDEATNTQTFSSIIKTVPNDTVFTQDDIMWSSDVVPSKSLDVKPSCEASPSDWYAVEMNWLTTSFADGTVRLHYRSQPLDENGLPLIPDNQNYKEALYLYVRAKMIGSGYQDKVYQEQTLMQRFEIMGRRAINEITYPTPDEKEQQVKTQVRFIPPDNYWENFFRVDSHETFKQTI